MKLETWMYWALAGFAAWYLWGRGETPAAFSSPTKTNTTGASVETWSAGNYQSMLGTGLLPSGGIVPTGQTTLT